MTSSRLATTSEHVVQPFVTAPPPTPPDALREALERALGAQYAVVGLLGRGGMGAVYLARERLLERQVAIKVLPSESADAEARERFLREARTAAQLSHPNIVPLLSFGEMGDTLFYIMRYVDGESLATRLRREGRLPPPDARRILTDLADALAEAHRLGIVHRDLKPDNVMIDRSTGRAMLTDFGIARQLASSATLTGTGIIVGSPQYMSPEQASGDRAVDGRSDLYSLGILGYRMLTGRLPFSGESVRELLVQQITSEPTAIATHAPEVPLDLAGAVTRCLAKDPERRWSDAQAFRFALTTSASNAPAIPEEIEGYPRVGTRAVQMAYYMDVGLVSLYAYTKDPEWLAVGLGVSLVGLLLPLTAFVIRGRRVGVSWKRALRMAFWPGSRSFVWWPRPLRPPDDVWDRLPQSVKRARGWQSVAVGLYIGVATPLFLAAFVSGGAHASLRNVLFQSGFAAIFAATGIIMGATISNMRRSRVWNLTDVERNKLLAEPTHGSRFWERPSIAAILNRAPEPAIEGPMSPDAMAQAVRTMAAELPSAAAPIAQEAADAARDLANELRALDKQIEELAQQADPAEQRRLEARIEALGTERIDEPDVARQMRELLRGQARLFAELETRRAQLESRRDARNEQLRTLWLQLMNYRVQIAAQSEDAGELSGRIRELCRSIERRAAAVAEPEGILG